MIHQTFLIFNTLKLTITKRYSFFSLPPQTVYFREKLTYDFEANKGAARRLLTCLLLCTALSFSSSFAETPKPNESDKIDQSDNTNKSKVRKIEVLGVKGDALDNIAQNVELLVLQSQKTKINDSVWSSLSNRVSSQIQEAVKPYGYYNASVVLTKPSPLDTKPLYRYQVSLGDPVLIRDIKLVIKGDGNNDSNFTKWIDNYPLEIGDSLNQPLYESSKQALLSLANEYGYFDSELLVSRINIDENKQNASIELVLDSGVRYRYGDTTISWDKNREYKNISEDLVSQYIETTKGNYFVDSDILSTQQSMLGTQYFTAVEARPQIDKRANQEVPIAITLKPKKRFAYAVSLGAGTDTGPRATISFEDRRFNKKSHRILGNLGISDEEQNVLLSYQIPLKSSPTDSINTFISYTNEDSEFRIRETTIFGSEVTRVKDDWQWSYGLSYRDETFVQDDVDVDSELLIPRLRWQRTSTDNLSNPTKGWSASAIIQGANESIASDVDFVQLIINAKALYPFWQGRLIGRLELAGTNVDDAQALPSSLRFLAGGDNSLRGYKFESIGFEGETGIEGASKLFTGSIEYEHPIKSNFGVAAFIDFGDAFNDNISIKRGAGLGLRYRLPFGAVRLDVASALDLEDKPLRLHFTFGADL